MTIMITLPVQLDERQVSIRTVDSLDEEGGYCQVCDSADCVVQAQMYYRCLDSREWFVSGSIACLAELWADRADRDARTVIEIPTAVQVIR